MGSQLRGLVDMMRAAAEASNPDAPSEVPIAGPRKIGRPRIIHQPKRLDIQIEQDTYDLLQAKLPKGTSVSSYVRKLIENDVQTASV